MFSPFLVALAAVCVTFLLIIFARWSSKTTFPPGPTPLPLVGNVLDLKSKELWLHATSWARQFGDVTYLHVFGQGLIFLSSPEATTDLLDKKGSIYSDKPRLVMAGELCGCESMVAFTPYGDQSKRQRRLLTRAFGVSVIPTYHPLIATETRRFLQSLVREPSRYADFIRRYAGGLTLSVVYGYQAQSDDDTFLNLADECVDLLSNHIASGGGIWPVDIFPSLKYYPEQLPGGSFRTKARAWKAKMEDFVEKPYDFVRKSVHSGDYLPSFCSNLMQDRDPYKQDDQFQFDLKWTANSMYSASIDTTLTVTSHFILAMVLHPEALAKAQAELDRVVGQERLPNFSDRPLLPYTDALLNEIYRWGVPVPLSLPHRLTEDDVYRGMHIPAGSLIFANVWAICRDPTIFPEPNTFVPERYLENVDATTARQRDPRNYVFGFGRRRCPGANLVESSVWLLIASMIATLNMTKAKDSEGRQIEPVVKFENSVFRVPNSFECDIRPRSEKALQLIREADLPL